jgi:uncharacterized phiE125 gp8 family phage protein
MLTLMTPAAATPVSLADLKSHLQIDHSGHDTTLAAFLSAAVALYDGPRGTLGRALVTQTWEWSVDAWCHFGGVMPLRAASITSIKYDDVDGAEQTLATTVYAMVTGPAGTSIRLKPSQSWPAIADGYDRIRVRFVAGYGDADKVPGDIKVAILMKAAHFFTGRGDGDTEAGSPDTTIKRLLTKSRAPIW